ncbi:hypothetical protein BDN70DRAFT_887494 [Pholiota conissans]|uniref:Uncharacterized protein n=1 Tax=Pholiota conissans TaxID=109636 RepID=A0A9P5YQS7_9AGAR|nr:hypothetical protein BDN70DRAFT_887494 [Pholiota conissans]
MPTNDAYFYTPCVQSQTQSCNPCFPLATSNAIPIESLSLSQLYQVPVVKNLMENYQSMFRFNLRMEKENQMLQERIDDLTARRALLENVSRMHSSGIEYPPEMTPTVPSTPSLSPDDSISQAGGSPVPPPAQPLDLPFNREYNRPPQYPSSVLWHFQDSQHDSTVISRGNKSRPNMERCIRHPDGRPIVRYEWRAIMTSAKRAIEELLRPLGPPGDPLATRTHYKNTHPDAWTRAIAYLEAQQPLTALCASHWKAEHVLGQMLVTKRSVEVRSARVRESRRLAAANGVEPAVNNLTR